MKNRNICALLIIITMMVSNALTTSAQLNPMKAQYFQNPYLVNPAMAGVDGNAVFVSYANQWNKISGSPVLLALSASGMVTDKVALGFNLQSDRAGLLKKTQALGTFAYRLELDEEKSIRFGLSFSWLQDRLDLTDATGGGTPDPAWGQYNDRKNYLDGNFGIAYLEEKFTAQFSYLNINQKRQRDLSAFNYPIFYSSVSYLFDLDEASGITVKPLIAFRGIKGNSNQFDITAEWGVDKFLLYSMYHSNKSFAGGIGFKNLNMLSMSAIYSTEPQGLQGLTGGRFDLTIGYHFSSRNGDSSRNLPFD